MSSKNTPLIWCLGCFLIFITMHLYRTELVSSFRSCSRRCRNNNTNVTSELQFNCSCSSSCSFFGDCCYDAESRVRGDVRPKGPHMCLSISPQMRVQAVSRCPTSSPRPRCTQHIGSLPPVTSRSTGTTYLNIHCAACNGDDEDLVTWYVKLRCCPHHDGNSKVNITSLRYTYSKGYIWSRVKTSRRNRSYVCRCRYISNKKFLDSLELRSCSETVGTSKCSATWTDKETESLCSSYMDPVYFGDKMYRNPHCAACNYKRLRHAKCWPPVVDSMLSRGLTISDVLSTCASHRSDSCLQFFHSRGKSYALSRMLDISEKRCIPSSDKRCCQGETFDFRAKRCRKLVY